MATTIKRKNLTYTGGLVPGGRAARAVAGAAKSAANAAHGVKAKADKSARKKTSTRRRQHKKKSAALAKKALKTTPKGKHSRKEVLEGAAVHGAATRQSAGEATRQSVSPQSRRKPKKKFSRYGRRT